MSWFGRKPRQEAPPERSDDFGPEAAALVVSAVRPVAGTSDAHFASAQPASRMVIASAARAARLGPPPDTAAVIAAELYNQILDDGFDTYWTVAEIDQYIVDFARWRHGDAFADALGAAYASGIYDEACAGWGRDAITQAFAALPGVRRVYARWLSKDCYASLRARHAARFGRDRKGRPLCGRVDADGVPVVPEKFHIYEVRRSRSISSPDRSHDPVTGHRSVNGPSTIRPAAVAAPDSGTSAARSGRFDGRTPDGFQAGVRPDSPPDCSRTHVGFDPDSGAIAGVPNGPATIRRASG